MVNYAFSLEKGETSEMTTKIRKLCAFAALAAMCVMRPALADVDWNSGRILVDADYEGISNIGANGDTVVFQDDHSVTIKGSPYIGTSAATAVPASPLSLIHI